MKKQIVTACALIASVAAFAASVTSDNTFGVLKVSASAGQTIIPVPWEAVGGGDIVVTNYVLTTGLTNDDLLYWYDASAGSYKVWKVADGKWATHDTTKITASDITPVASELTQGFPRGGAAVLELSVAKTVYLSGQYIGTSVTTTVYGLSDGEKALYGGKKSKSTMIAPPKAKDYNLNSEVSFYSSYTSEDVKTDATSEQLVGDQILLNNGTSYYYGNTGSKYEWYKKTESGKSAENITIPAGEGAWYLRKNDGNITLVW